MSKDPFRYFRVEARELLDGLGQGVLRLERGEVDADLVPRLLRLAHTLKGAARVVQQPRIAELAHRLEDVLAPLRDQRDAPPRACCVELLELLDQVGTLLRAIAAPAAPVATTGAGAAGRGAAGRGAAGRAGSAADHAGRHRGDRRPGPRRHRRRRGDRERPPGPRRARPTRRPGPAARRRRRPGPPGRARAAAVELAATRPRCAGRWAPRSIAPTSSSPARARSRTTCAWCRCARSCRR